MLAYKYRGDLNLERDISTLIENCIYTAPFNTLNDKDEATFNNTFFRTLSLIEDIFRGNTEAIKQYTDNIIAYKEVLGVYSMCKSQFSFHMWREYANEHRGFCIEYDFDKLCEEVNIPINNDINSVEVDYQDNFPTVDFEDLRNKKNLLTKLYGTKLRKWEIEAEIRILKDKFGKKQYFPASLKAIYFGDKASLELKNKIIDALKNFDVKFYQIQVSEEGQLIASFIGENSRPIKRLDKSTFEFFGRHDLNVENFYVIFKPSVWSHEEVRGFIDNFNSEYSTKMSNIYLFDNTVNKKLLLKNLCYLSNEEFANLEEHKIATKNFSGDEILFAKK